MLFQPLSMELRQARRPLILDPLVALAGNGPLLARGLARHAEVWLVPEFWRMLDNTCFWLEHPERLVPDEAPAAAAEARAALDSWERLRLASDPAALDMFWIAEEPADALLPTGRDAAMVHLWRALAEALTAKAGPRFKDGGALVRGWRDSLALAAALGDAVILSRHDEDGRRPPPLCRGAAEWGLASSEAPEGRLANLERAFLCELLVHCGLTRLVWSGLDLMLVWVVAPATAGLVGMATAGEREEAGEAVPAEWRRPADDPWRAARLFYKSL